MESLIALKNKHQVKIGDNVYIVDGNAKYLRKITWIGEEFLEWDCGFFPLIKVELNTNKKSKVKFIVNIDK